VTRPQIIATLCGVLAAVALAYFALLAANPQPIARVLLPRGYALRGWTQERLARRVRFLALAGAVLSGAAIVLAVKLLIG
jgi:hypothetical protein